MSQLACGFSLRTGHPHTCIKELGFKDIYLIETLPGQGWDNLQNEDRVTADQKFLIPDMFSVYPSKTSQLHTVSEIIEHWDEHTSTTAISINRGVGVQIPGIANISGKFSAGYEKMKKRQFFERTVSLRSQDRYSKYRTKIGSVGALSDSFFKKVSKIGEYILLNQTDLATYESQLLVREYGTHVVTAVELGAMIVQVDYLDSKILQHSSEEKKRLLIGGEASFNIKTIAKVGTSFEFPANTTKRDMEYYQNSVQSVEVWTVGGIEYSTAEGFNTSWIESINNNQVPIDKEGDPIYHFINEYTLPDMPSIAVFKAYESVKNAVLSYYKHNTNAGCTLRGSPYFDFSANVDDGTCSPPKESFVFGEVYQTCTMHGMPEDCIGNDLCSSVTQKNPLTDDFFCENDYEPIALKHGTFKGSCIVKKERKCGLLWSKTCYDFETYSTLANYSAYWCAAKNATKPSRRLLFGGTFTPFYENPATQSISCPHPFYRLTIAKDLSVCVSSNIELSNKNSIPFAGFHSCTSKNPFTNDRGYCPTGYSQHLATVVDGCEISVCVKLGARNITRLPHIQMPPYIDRPIKASATGVEERFSFNAQTSEWENDLFQQGSTNQSTEEEKNGTNKY
ncbi:MPEG1-like protein, partial [Mya arenaria]